MAFRSKFLWTKTCTDGNVWLFLQHKINVKGIMNGSDSQRLSQEDKRDQAPIGRILEQAQVVAQGVLESIQSVAGTTVCKGIQIVRLKDWAIGQNLWIEAASLGIYADRGSENEVYLSTEGNVVYKLNDFRYSDDNLTPFFDRIKAHNQYFPDCAYTLLGFAENKNGKVCAVLSQPYIISEREATEKEINNELQRLGFMPQIDGEYYSNKVHDIFDASPNNVLVGIDGNLYFIDTIIYKSDEKNLNIYKKQSPKFSKSSD